MKFIRDDAYVVALTEISWKWMPDVHWRLVAAMRSMNRKV